MPTTGSSTLIGGITCSSIKYKATGFVSFRAVQASNGIANDAKIQKLGLRNPAAVNTYQTLRRRQKSLSLLKCIMIVFAGRNTIQLNSSTTIIAFKLLTTIASHAC
jgi:hypothetical protein